MKKRKLKLDSLKVISFVLNTNLKPKILGGKMCAPYNTHTFQENCTNDCVC